MWSLVRLSRFLCVDNAFELHDIGKETVSVELAIKRKKNKKKKKRNNLRQRRSNRRYNRRRKGRSGDLWSDNVTLTGKAFLIRISIAALILGSPTSILTTHLLPTCGHPIMQLEKRESGNSKGAKRPKVYRYRTWQDTVARHTLSSFELVRVPTTLMYSLLISKTSSSCLSDPYISRWKYENRRTTNVSRLPLRSILRTFLLKLKRFRLTMINNIWSHYAADTSVIASCSTWAQLADPCLWG